MVPRHPDVDGRFALPPNQVGREKAIELCRKAAPDRVHVFDVENHEGTPVYVHAKVCVVDDVWASVGSDNFNRRSWTHDSELSCAVLDETPRRARAGRPGRARRRRPALRPGPAAARCCASTWTPTDDEDLIDPDATARRAMTAAADALRDWHAGGRSGSTAARPAGAARDRSGCPGTSGCGRSRRTGWSTTRTAGRGGPARAGDW